MGWETGSQGPALLESAESPGTSHCLHLSFLILGWLTHEDSREGHSGFLVLRASSVSSSVDGDGDGPYHKDLWKDSVK